MSNRAHPRSESSPSKSDVEALYEVLFGTPALDTTRGESNELERYSGDNVNAFARVRNVAEEHPWLALRAVYAGVRAHFRAAHPFDYAVKEARTGEVSHD